MSYFHTCPHCGANLDPGEACDCREKKAAQGAANTRDCRDKERAAQGATNTQDGETEHVDHAVSASNNTRN